MVDSLTPAQRRHCMSQVKGRNTQLEVLLRKALWGQGLRYKIGSKLLGKPDLVFVGARVVVFVDGCFWHNCPIHGQRPKTNAEFWQKKLDKNRERDEFVTAELVRLGWTVVRFWEHEVKNDLDRCIADVEALVGLRKISRGKKTNQE